MTERTKKYSDRTVYGVCTALQQATAHNLQTSVFILPMYLRYSVRSSASGITWIGMSQNPVLAPKLNLLGPVVDRDPLPLLACIWAW
jgi:hypothetical protein